MLKKPSFWNEVKACLWKEAVLEWRFKTALNGLFLFVAGSTYIIYLSFKLRRGELSPPTWNAVFWIVQVFTAITATSKSFDSERSGRFYLYYLLVRPQALIVAKMAYNIGLLWLLNLSILLLFSIWLGTPIQDFLGFGLSVMLGSMAFGATLTLVSAIAAKAQGSGVLMPVLSFPLLFPTLLQVMSISKRAVEGLDSVSQYGGWPPLLAMAAISLVLPIVLYPYLWKN